VSVTVLYFAAVRDLVGTGEERLELPASVGTLALLAEHLVTLHPPLEGRLGYVRFARNEVFAALNEPVVDGDTVALLPPVAGG
jgi:molybdopterin converting factor subunit 1